jgi:aspartate aminotransferase-like enzyme/phosphatidylglycerophosphate synthase
VTEATTSTKPWWLNTPYPPLYLPFKLLSERLARRLIESRLSANLITVAWALVLVAASAALAFEHTGPAFLAVLLAVLLDCLDGDLARGRNQASLSGTYLEQIAHWIGNMSLMAGAGAALLLADPSPGNILLVSTLAVVQAVYVAVIRQVRSDAANIPEHPLLRQTFRIVVRTTWYLSPIELPIVGAFVLLGVTEGSVLGITILLAMSAAAVFVMHFLLTLANDRRQWNTVPDDDPETFANLMDRYAADTVQANFPVARWWTPGSSQLPPAMLSLMGRPPMAAGSPVLQSARRELAELLPQLFRTSGRVLTLACPLDVAQEAVIGSLCVAGDEILAVGGRAAVARWRSVGKRLGVQVAALEVPFGADLSLPDLEEALARNPGVQVVCLPLGEAESGSLIDLAAVAMLMEGGPWLKVVDAGLGFCADDLRMDEWRIDVALSSSDSGVMAPPGLSLVAVAPRALEALDGTARSAVTGTYLDLRTHLGNEPPSLLPATALTGLFVAARMILALGLDSLLNQRARAAQRFRHGCTEEAGLSLVAQRPSAACTVALLPEGLPLVQLQGALFASRLMVIASGMSADGTTTLQFGHTGWLFDSDVDAAIDALRAAVRR